MKTLQPRIAVAVTPLALHQAGALPSLQALYTSHHRSNGDDHTGLDFADLSIISTDGKFKR